MTSSCVAMERNGRLPTLVKAAEDRDGTDEPALCATLIETIRLARHGDWADAERVLYSALSTVAPEALPHVYIACVELVPTLLSESTRHEWMALEAPRLDWKMIESRWPRPRPGTDPALNYTHAIVTALRLRLVTAEPPRVKQAS